MQLQVLVRRLHRVACTGEPEPPRPARRHLPSPVVLAVDRAGFAYPGAERQVFEDVSFRLEAGQLLAVVGPSGCGKSTLARIITGLLDPTSGTVALAADVTVAYVPQHAYLFSGTLRENLAFGAQVDDHRLVDCARQIGLDRPLDTVGLDGDIVPLDLDRAERQQLVLARALAPQPDLLVLDETLADLDSGQARRIEHMLRGTGAAIVLISHDSSLTDRAEHVIWFGTVPTGGRPSEGRRHGHRAADQVAKGQARRVAP